MAVKKVKESKEKVEVVEANVEVAETEIENVETAEETVEETMEETMEEPTEVEIDNTVEIEVEEDETENEKDDIVVDTENINLGKKPSGNVKIRMREDHKCCIAMERYDLKAGKTYTVPENVKTILNKAGLLAPL